MTRISNSNHTWSSGFGSDVALVSGIGSDVALVLVLMLPWLFGIGSDVVLTPANFQAYPEFKGLSILAL